MASDGELRRLAVHGSLPSLHSAENGLVKRDKAAQVLGISSHQRASMEPSPPSRRPSSSSLPAALPGAAHEPTSTLASLYVVSGLPKSPHTWMLADAESTIGLAHSQGAVGRFWRAEVLGSTVSPGIGGASQQPSSSGRSRRQKEKRPPGVGAPTKQETARLLSKALKFSFPREIEIIASTLQPVSTVHNFSFTLPAPNPSNTDLPSAAMRNSTFSGATSTANNRLSSATYGDIPRPSTAFLGPTPTLQQSIEASNASTVTYHGVCLTVWSHADEERSVAIRRALEQRTRKASSQTLPNAPTPRRLHHKPSNASASSVDGAGPAIPVPSIPRVRTRSSKHGPWSGTEAETDAETDGGMASESEYEYGAGTATERSAVGESTLFLPQDTVFWLPYALTLVSRHPIYDLMRDYLTLSWARFSKDVQAHTLQIAKILSHPAPRGGEVVRLDASAAPAVGSHKRSSSQTSQSDTTLEVVCRFPGGMDFGRGLVDANFTMWPLFKALDLDNILTLCEVGMAPTGRVLFLSRYPAMLGVAVLTVKYLLELRGWNGIACPIVHCRDARIYADDPGPWLLGMSTEARYTVHTSPEVCVVDLDINHVSCAAPPIGCISSKGTRERFRRQLQAAFDAYWHPDCSIPSEFKEAFPAGRFRPLTKIQSKRAGIAAVAAESVAPPEWWNGPKVIQAFNAVLTEKSKKPTFLQRLTGAKRRPHALTTAEQLIQLSIRKRATAFVDSRDEMESKIGRLARRLNFLMTESDLWREKFVTFEKYAEKLSLESAELRSKINKEQRESRRLSGLVSVTAQEKIRLQSQLQDTEKAHKEARDELERMRVEIERMETERTAMIAEVEAQIERALSSMAFSETESDMGSRASSRRPSFASPSPSAVGSAFADIRSESIAEEGDEVVDTPTHTRPPREIHVEAATTKKTEEKEVKVPNYDGSAAIHDSNMSAVDLGITEKSERIARKVLAIQEKLEIALAGEEQKRRGGSDSESDAPMHVNGRGQLRPSRTAAPIMIPSPRTVSKEGSMTSMNAPTISPSTPAVTTDDSSDTDWKSAYSHSPRPDQDDDDVAIFNGPDLTEFGPTPMARTKSLARGRAESGASNRTAGATEKESPTLSDFTLKPAPPSRRHH